MRTRNYPTLPRLDLMARLLLIPIATLAFLAFALPPVFGQGPVSDEEVVTFEIRRNRDFKRVDKQLAQSDAPHVIVKIAAGRYKLRDTFRIGRSNVSLIGEPGVELRLANRVQRPVIAVGSQVAAPREADRIANIVISDLVIDGNRDKQFSEFDKELPWIRNNGIDVRAVSHLLVERVTSNRNRSGGLVISWACEDVLVRDSIFEDNFFDGVAYYDSARVYTVDSVMRNNRGAGISLDNEFVDSMFARCQLESNRDVGVFVRSAERLVFYNCDVSGSGNWAFFLSHDDHGRGVFDVDISQCRVSSNNGGVYMGSVTEAQSSRNSLSYTTFQDNGRRGRPEYASAGSRLELSDEKWTDPEALAKEIELDAMDDASPYADQLDQAINTIQGAQRG